MICPKCKEKNQNENVNCQQCGLKLKTTCPRCKQMNTLGQPKCVNCGLTLIRFCPECKTPNFPHVANCRKCGNVLLKKKPPAAKPEVLKPEGEKQVVIKLKAPRQEAKHEPEEIKISQLEKTPEKNPKKTGIKSEKNPEKNPEKIEEKLPEITQEIISSIEEQESRPQPESQPPSVLSASPQEVQEPKEEGFTFELKKELSREETISTLEKILSKSEKGYLISLTGADGIGKTTVITTISQSLKEQKLTWLSGMCDPYTQNISYSFFRDMIVTLLGLPAFSLNNDELKKSIKKILEANLGITNGTVLKSLYKIILNEYQECSASIEKNNEEANRAIYELITALNKKAGIVLIVEDFEYIDKASFDCIKFLMKQGFLDNKNFLIINHTPATNIAKLFPVEMSQQKMLIMFIKPLAATELDFVIQSMLNNQDILPEELKSRIIRQAKGLPIYVEQALWYLFQLGAIQPQNQELVFNPQYKDIDINPDINGIFMQRFALIEKVHPDAITVMLTAALLGVKFIPKLIEMATDIKEKELQPILQMLINTGMFTVYSQYNFGFKHLSLWKIIFERGFSDEQIKILSINTLNVLKDCPDAKNALLAKLAGYAEDYQNLVHYYNNAAQEAFSYGDILSYTNNQAKILELLGSSTLSDEEINNNRIVITEQIGKVNYEANPALATNYLKESIKQQEELGNNVKVIELTGFLSRSCELAGNYQGVLDCAEKALGISTQEESNPVEIMLLDFSKLEATFNLGRLEETIMTAENEILPILNRIISKNEQVSGLSAADLKDVEYQTEFTLAKAFTYQGNLKALELLKKLVAKAEKDKNPEYETKALLNQALFFILQGDLRSSDEILEKLAKNDYIGKNADQLHVEWLFVNTLSHMLEGKFDKARNTCYSALPLAKEGRNYNLFTILKLLNGFFYQHFQHHNNAMAIFDEVAHYCSENKMATGALFSWYFAAAAELQTGNPERAEEIAEKALDISKKPNIRNFISEILLSRLIAEVKTIKGDFEGAQIYIENGLELAEKNKLYYGLIQLYITFGKIYQENAAIKEHNREHTSNYAYRLFTKALNLAEKLDNNFIIGGVEREISNLQTFCRLSGITLVNET